MSHDNRSELTDIIPQYVVDWTTKKPTTFRSFHLWVWDDFWMESIDWLRVIAKKEGLSSRERRLVLIFSYEGMHSIYNLMHNYLNQPLASFFTKRDGFEIRCKKPIDSFVEGISEVPPGHITNRILLEVKAI